MKTGLARLFHIEWLCLIGLAFLINCSASDASNPGNPYEDEFLEYNLVRCLLEDCSDSSNSNENSGGGGGGSGTPVFYIYTNGLTVTGNLGSRATSTSSCQSMQTATYPALTCTNYLAVASYPGDDLLNASTNHSVPAGRTLTSESGTTVASSWSAFLTGPTVTLQAAGVANTTPTPFYWTSTAVGGGFDATYNCTNNSDGTNGAVGSQGAITTTAGTHIRFAVSQPCDGSTNSAYLMCICWN